MVMITSITTQKKPGRYNLYLDGQFAFAVADRTLIRFGLAKGLTLTPEQVAAIQQDDVRAKALAQALNYLSHQARTVHQVHQFLADKEVDTPGIEAVIAELVSLHYLDDAEYARRFVTESISRGDRGPQAVRQWLRQRGVTDNDIEDALDAYDEDAQMVAARRLAAKGFAHPGSKSLETLKQTVIRQLRQKGFDTEIVMAAVAVELPEPDEEREQSLLEAAAEKAWRQKKGADAYTRRQKVKQALYRKGFDLDAIDAVLDNLVDE